MIPLQTMLPNLFLFDHLLLYRFVDVVEKKQRGHTFAIMGLPFVQTAMIAHIKQIDLIESHQTISTSSRNCGAIW